MTYDHDEKNIFNVLHRKKKDLDNLLVKVEEIAKIMQAPMKKSSQIERIDHILQEHNDKDKAIIFHFAIDTVMAKNARMLGEIIGNIVATTMTVAAENGIGLPFPNMASMMGDEEEDDEEEETKRNKQNADGRLNYVG